jgi:hypothetical protein
MPRRFLDRPQVNSATFARLLSDRFPTISPPRQLVLLGATQFPLDVFFAERNSLGMVTARLALVTDLSSLLELFAASEVSPTIQPRERAETLWREQDSSQSDRYSQQATATRQERSQRARVPGPTVFALAADPNEFW